MNILATPYASIRAQLADEIAKTPWPCPEAGFLHYLNLTIGTTLDEHPPVTERLDETPILACAGYQYANPHFTRPNGYDEQWAQHYRRLASKQAFPIDRESYFYRPLDLLGICIGAHHCPAITEQDRTWLRKTLQEGWMKIPEGSRSYYLGGIAASHLRILWPIKQPRTKDLALPILSLSYWITKYQLLGKDFVLPEIELATAILSRVLMSIDQYDDLADAGLILYATQDVINRAIQSSVEEKWQEPVNARDSVALVCTICDHLPIAAKALARRHDNRTTITITDEYDVQDLLGALLKLHFSDVRPEEWTPSYAGNSSRMDFLLKPEQTVVEAKMTRKGLDQKEVVNQLAVDILRYQAHPDCRTLICFVYDPSGKCENPRALENDLTKKHGGLYVIVIVRPKHH
ncbi:MAG: hypothetical protein C4576_17505 [Desulfobacteraceae bacterium]|nr:MAG: hypothetical protein C4576_17505 [Desulfobacteraceae bacterium]